MKKTNLLDFLAKCNQELDLIRLINYQTLITASYLDVKDFDLDFDFESLSRLFQDYTKSFNDLIQSFNTKYKDQLIANVDDYYQNQNIKKGGDSKDEEIKN